MSILVIDVGTSSIRAAVVRADGTFAVEHRRPLLPSTPAPGLVEFDARRMADVALEMATLAIDEHGAVASVGITNQRASTVVWDRATGEPVGPGLGWQDLRTIGDCLVLQAEGFRFAPNQSATKARNLLDHVDPDRERDLCVGTVDSWIVWNLTGGSTHVTDTTNAGLTGLLSVTDLAWDTRALDALRIAPAAMPRIVDSSGDIAPATVLPGAPVIRGVAGDQQASLLGQGCVRTGQAKITFGTGGMLDLVTGEMGPSTTARGDHGSFPIIAWQRNGIAVWGREAIMLSAGTNVEWLRDDLGILDDVGSSHDVAQQCADTEGVVYVPALLGLGTPHWDYGARGALFGLTRGSGRPHIVRAVLEGVAQRGADLVEATESDVGLSIGSLRVDGGMSANPTFIQALADATGRSVEVSPALEATALGAAFLAGLADGTWSDLDDIGATWRPRAAVEPAGPAGRERWLDAVERARSWFPELSSFDF